MAETIAVNGQVDFGVHSRYRTMRLLCIADEGDGSFDIALPNDCMVFLGGMLLERFKIVAGAGGPTINSDLTMTDVEEATADLLGGEGADIVDLSDVNVVVLTTPVPLYEAFVLHVTNNIVNSAVFELVLIFPSID